MPGRDRRNTPVIPAHDIFVTVNRIHGIRHHAMNDRTVVAWSQMTPLHVDQARGNDLGRGNGVSSRSMSSGFFHASPVRPVGVADLDYVLVQRCRLSGAHGFEFWPDLTGDAVGTTLLIRPAPDNDGIGVNALLCKAVAGKREVLGGVFRARLHEDRVARNATRTSLRQSRPSEVAGRPAPEAATLTANWR